MTSRIYVTERLNPGSELHLEDQLHYMRNVMRLPVGAEILVFNGVDGEWLGKIESYGKKSATVICLKQEREQTHQKPLTLMCALIKHSRLEFLMEKATELGISDIQPIVTDHCSYRKINTDRLSGQTIEAAEQSERLTIPTIHKLVSLREAVQNYDGNILWADESRNQTNTIVKTLNSTQITAILIGPEGGFSSLEKEYLQSQSKVHPVNMGKLILRAETAAIALIAVCQLK